MNDTSEFFTDSFEGISREFTDIQLLCESGTSELYRANGSFCPTANMAKCHGKTLLNHTRKTGSSIYVPLPSESINSRSVKDALMRATFDLLPN